MSLLQTTTRDGGNHSRKDRRCPYFLFFLSPRKTIPPGVSEREKRRKLRSAEEKGGRIIIKVMAIHLLPFKINRCRACKQLMAYSRPSYRRAEKPEDEPPNGLRLPNGFSRNSSREMRKGHWEAGLDAISPRCYTCYTKIRRKGRYSSTNIKALCRSKTGSGRGGRCCVIVARAPNQIKTHREHASQLMRHRRRNSHRRLGNRRRLAYLLSLSPPFILTACRQLCFRLGERDNLQVSYRAADAGPHTLSISTTTTLITVTN